MTNKKSHIRFRLVPKSTTLDDLEGPLCTPFQNTCLSSPGQPCDLVRHFPGPAFSSLCTFFVRHFQVLQIQRPGGVSYSFWQYRVNLPQAELTAGAPLPKVNVCE